MKQASVWLSVKIAILVLTFLSSVIKPLGGADALSPAEALTLAAVVTPVWILMLLLVVDIQAINPRSDAEWHYPRLTDSLLNFGQPLSFFHFFAFYSGSMAAGSLLAHLATGVENLWWVGAGAGTALGLLLGVRLCLLVFRWKRPKRHPGTESE
jgi:hypothetical protein